MQWACVSAAQAEMTDPKEQVRARDQLLADAGKHLECKQKEWQETKVLLTMSHSSSNPVGCNAKQEYLQNTLQYGLTATLPH